MLLGAELVVVRRGPRVVRGGAALGAVVAPADIVLRAILGEGIPDVEPMLPVRATDRAIAGDEGTEDDEPDIIVACFVDLRALW